MEYHIGNMQEFNTALDSLRCMGERGSKSITFKDGVYLLDKSILLDERDNGLILQGSDNTTLCGGYNLTSWRREGGFLRVGIPAGAEPRMFVAGGNVRPRSRYPEEGRLFNRNNPENLKWMSSTNGGWNRPFSRDELIYMAVVPEDIPASMDLTNSEITMYHIWDESTMRVRNYDSVTGNVEFMSEAGHAAGAFGRRGYVIWNTAEGLLKPGQWYFDRACREIVYYPMQEEKEKSLDAWIPLIDSLIKIRSCNRMERGNNKGSVNKDGYVDSICSDIMISGFNMTMCNTPAVAAGLRAINPAGAVDISYADNIKLEKLNIYNVAGSGIKMIRCRNLEVSRCRITQAGACGIFTYECENEAITDNTVRSIGFLSTSAIGIHCGGKSMLVYVLDGYPEEKGSVYLARNTIENVPYCGITCSGGPHKIEYNRLSNCMTVLHDGAAIYCSRAATGTVLKGNFVFNINHGHGEAYYLDEQSCGCIIEGNIASDVTIPLHNHLTTGVMVKNNVFINKDNCGIKMTNSRGLIWEDNILISGGSIDFEFKMTGKYGPYSEAIFNDIIKFGKGSIILSRTGKIMINDDEGAFPAIEQIIMDDPVISIDGDGKIVADPASFIAGMAIALPDGSRAGSQEDSRKPTRQL